MYILYLYQYIYICLYVSKYKIYIYKYHQLYQALLAIPRFPRSQVDAYSTKYHQANLYTETLNV